MLVASNNLTTKISSPVRTVKAKVEFYNGSTLVATYNYDDRLTELTIERVGEESSFFGFGICQRLNVKLIDKNRELNYSTANKIKVYFGIDNEYISPYPLFKISEIHRDELTNALSITAYDLLYEAKTLVFSDLTLTTPYTIQDVFDACILKLGAIGYSLVNIADNELSLSYTAGANFDGSENLKEVLNAIANATQSIYYVDPAGNIVLKRLDRDGEPLLTITKSDYFELNSGDNRRLATICHATELGDNVSASITETGTTVYIRENPFWVLRDDIGTLVDNALSAVGGLTINQFDCAWRGNFLLQIGDKIALTTKNNTTAKSFILDDTISYNGAFSEKTEWQFEDNEGETASNPTSLGEKLKQTYARVDKINKQIKLISSDVDANKTSIGSLQINVDGINASVKSIEERTKSALDGINNELETITKKVEATMTAEDVKLEIKKEIDNGVSKVETSTGFTFNEEGLTVNKSGSEIKTQITEDGMTVYKNNEAVLKANNTGVDAMNLRATTYLIIGNNSRFEDYDPNRTGGFFIGGGEN